MRVFYLGILIGCIGIIIFFTYYDDTTKQDPKYYPHYDDSSYIGHPINIGIALVMFGSVISTFKILREFILNNGRVTE